MSRKWISGLLASLFVVALLVAVPAHKAQAVISIEPTGETPGDVAIFPFYDVSSDTKYNYFYLVNTTGYWIQVHLRFRTMECSIECLDFDVIMSPYDVFVFWVMPDIDGLGPGFYSDDSNTIDYSGLMPADWKSGSPTIAKTPFDDSRLLDLHISQDDTQEMLKKGYVEAIVEGLIDKTFWTKCGPFKSLLAAAKTDAAESCSWDKGQSGTWAKMGGDLDNVGKAGHYWNGTAWNTVGDDNIQDGTIIFGNEYFLDFAALTGYGVNAATITGFRVYNSTDDTVQGTPANVTHIDDNFTYAAFGSVRSGYNGLILHPDYYATYTNDDNPYFRPDWATTFGPTLAFGDDFDNYTPTVYGSVDDIEENFATYMMDSGSRYAAHYLSDLSGVYTYVLLNFFTKHYHYFVKLLYDPAVATTFTHGYRGATGSYVSVNRKVDTDYNFNLPAIAPCNTDYWNVKFRFLAYDISENVPPGQVSPGTLVSFNQEAELLAVGPGADKLNTGSFVNGWFKLGGFVLDIDSARADKAASATGSKAKWDIGKLYDDPLDASTRYIFAIGYSYVDIPGYGQWKWDLTILDSPKGPSPQP